MSKVAIIGLCGDSLFYNLDHLPKIGETVHADYLHREVGGKGFNQAVALARQDVDVYFLGAVGNDDIALKCEEFLKQEGIHPFLIKKEIELIYLLSISSCNQASSNLLYIIFVP